MDVRVLFKRGSQGEIYAPFGDYQMNVWNKVFLGIIFTMAIAVVVLVAVEFEIRNRSQKYIADTEKKTADADERIGKIIRGADPQRPTPGKSWSDLSLEELRGLVSERYRERGTAWFNCIVANVEESTLPPALDQVIATIIITGPFAPSDTGTDTDVVVPETLRGVVYVFEESGPDDPDHIGIFLGRFTVEGEPTERPFHDDADNEKKGQQITLVSTDSISNSKIDQIFDASQSRWAIYLTPPVDRIAGIFDQLTEDEKQMIPAELQQKYQSRPMPELTDEEKEALVEELRQLAEDPNEEPEQRELYRKAVETWQRDPSKVNEIWELYWKSIDDPDDTFAQDLSVQLDWLYQQQGSLQRSKAAFQTDIEEFKGTVVKANTENEKLTQDCELEEKRRDAMMVQRNTVGALLEEYKAAIDKMVLQIEKLQALATAYVAQMTEYQLKVIEKIEEQIREEVGE